MGGQHEGTGWRFGFRRTKFVQERACVVGQGFVRSLCHGGYGRRRGIIARDGIAAATCGDNVPIKRGDAAVAGFVQRKYCAREYWCIACGGRRGEQKWRHKYGAWWGQIQIG